MNIPKKIGIIDNAQADLSRLRFDNWEGYDSALQRKYLAVKLNELIDFLSGHPGLANEFGPVLEQQGDSVVHQHEWRLNQRFANKSIFDCKICGETEIRLTPQSIA